MDMVRFAKAIGAWFKRQFTPTDVAWKAATRALWVLTFALVFVNALYSVIETFTLERLMGFGVVLTIPFVIALGYLFALLLVSRLRVSYHFAFLIAIFFAMMTGGAAWGVKGGLAFAAISILSLSFLAGGLASMRCGTRFHWVTLLVTFSGFVGIVALAFGILKDGEDLNPTMASFVLEDRTIAASDPGVQGSHSVRTLTYGSGTDKNRPEFGEEVDIVAPSVDGSVLVDRWSGSVGWARTRYWGFDATELPLQGRVWMPEGEGPFPLVLVVHGNHGMEDFSDPGYDYLGEHLASQGFILVSVDENFLNSSYADMLNPLEPGIGSENDARGWVLLEHLSLWREWMADDSHELFGKADLSRIALIGHSRGGEAVAHAAAFNTLQHYPDDATLAFDYGFDIGGIIAIAPADGQYRPRKRFTPLRDVNYFTIHGSLDGDVQSFMGVSQLSRVAFSGDEMKFKSSLYIDGANHGQFNTSWGRNDFGMPFGWFLDTKQIMDPEEQRDIARTYFHAFLQVTLNGQDQYRALFKDPRLGAAWLPNRYYVANYADSETEWLATFDEDLDPATATVSAGAIIGENLSKWKETWVDLKWNPLDSHVAIFAWDERVHEDTASFAIQIDRAAYDLSDATHLVFAATQSAGGTLPKDFDSDDEELKDEAEDAVTEEDEEEDSTSEPLDWTIVLTDSAGEEASLPLSHDLPLYPQLKARTRRASFMEEIAESEALLRHYSFDLGDFLEVNPNFSPAQLSEIRFVFDKSERGAVILDDVGLR